MLVLSTAGVKQGQREREGEEGKRRGTERERNVHKLHITVSLQVLLCTINIVLCHLEISLLSQLGCDLS